MQGILSAITEGKWFADPDSLKGYLPVAASFLLGKRNPFVDDLSEERKKHRPYLMSIAEPYDIFDYGEGIMSNPDRAPKNSIAVIPVWGMITNDDQMSGPSGTKTKSKLLDQIAANENIVGVIFDFDTPGGELSGTRQFANKIFNFEKPTVGFIKDMSASAGAWMATACDYIIIEDDEMTRMGSIGGYKTMADFTRYFRNEGIDIKTVYAKQSVRKNKSLKRDDDTTDDKVEISDYTQVFIDDVKRFRGDRLADVEEIIQGELFRGRQIIEMGLADAVGTMSDAVVYINQQIGQSTIATVAQNNTQSQSTQSTNINDTMKIKDTWKNVRAFFGADKEELNEEDVEKLNTELGSKDEQISTLTSEKQQLEQDKQSLEAEKKQLEEQKKALEDEKKQLEADKTQLEQDKATAEKKLAEKPRVSSAKIKKEKDKDELEDDIPMDAADEEIQEML